MNIGQLFIVVVAVLLSVEAISIDHDKVQPFPQPDPVTISEKAGVKFKPLLHIDLGCVPYPAVNAAGETTGGLKGTRHNSGCKLPPLGSQVYGRAEWYNDVWAIMYAWYFPKGYFGGSPFWRHDWANAVVWIDNPALENAKVLGLSLSPTNNNKYPKRFDSPEEIVNNGTTPFISRAVAFFGDTEFYAGLQYLGSFQDLIMWDQLTDAARAALNDEDNFGGTGVPLSDDQFVENLENAWPF